MGTEITKTRTETDQQLELNKTGTGTAKQLELNKVGNKDRKKLSSTDGIKQRWEKTQLNSWN